MLKLMLPLSIFLMIAGCEKNPTSSDNADDNNLRYEIYSTSTTCYSIPDTLHFDPNRYYYVICNVYNDGLTWDDWGEDDPGSAFDVKKGEYYFNYKHEDYLCRSEGEDKHLHITLYCFF